MKQDMNKSEHPCALTTGSDNDFTQVIFIGVAPTNSAIHLNPGS